MGELPLDAFDLRLERTRRADEESLRARSQSLRLELRHRHARSRPTSPRSASAPKPTAASSARPSVAGLVGLKPTVGLVSRNGIIPISQQPGHGRPDGAHRRRRGGVLAAMVGRDDADAATAQQRRQGGRSTTPARLDAERAAGRAHRRAAQGRWAGIPTSTRRWSARSPTMKSAGARSSTPRSRPTGKWDDAEFEVLLYEFKAGLEHYLADARRADAARWRS